MNNPNPKKPLTSKIFAILACVLVLLFTVIPCSAMGIQDANRGVLSAHPYTPNSITYFDDTLGQFTQDVMSAIPRPPTTNPNNSTTATVIYNIIDYAEIVASTSILSTPQYGKIYLARTTTSLTCTHTAFNWGTFTLPTNFDLAIPYFPQIVVQTQDADLCQMRFKAVDSNGNEYVAQVTTTSHTDIHYVGEFTKIFLRDYVHNPDYPVTIVDMDVDVIFDTHPIYRWDVYYNIIDVNTDTATYNPVRVPKPTNATGLFNWLSPTIKGVLDTPILPINETMSISIGTCVAIVVGLGMIFAFLRFFRGG